MKRVLAALLMCFLLASSAALAQGTITACGITVDADAEAIDFGEVKVTDLDALTEMLDAMPHLTQVDMYASRLKKQEMDMLFNRYPQITFGWTYYVGDHLVRTDMTAFSTLHGDDPGHSEKDFQWLKFCKGLKAIDVGHNWISDVSWLLHFPELKVLILAVGPLADITPLSQLTELEYLELFTNRVTDISPLSQLTNLRDLNIKNNPVRDLSPLFGMTWLERLWVGGERMRHLPQEQIDALYAALPECEIDWENQPTAGTWRTHPHYFTIYEMFHGTQYIPFNE
ncbi:MAG: leucine-rich repeat domain-containing protein [Clostridia bacterium]|nr:leucine-rich repeat domain-containing protein [Clostridia bacterium]